MFYIYLLNFIKKHFVHMIVVLLFTLILGYLSIVNYELESEILQLNQDKALVEKSRALARQQAIQDMELLSEKYKQKSIEREKEYDEKYQKLLTDYAGVKSSVSGLYNTTSKISDSIHDTNTSRETIIRYVDNYKTVFEQCVSEYSEMGRDAEQQVIIINLLDKELEDTYSLLNEYKQRNTEVSN